MTNQKHKLNNLPYFFICSILTILFDFWATNTVIFSNQKNISSSRFFDFTYIENTGAAFSLFKNQPILLSIISITALLVIVYILWKNRYKYTSLTFFFSSLLFAGIFCNTFERIYLGHIRDFIACKFINFPIFNISDILINCAVLAIIYLILTKQYLRK